MDNNTQQTTQHQQGATWDLHQQGSGGNVREETRGNLQATKPQSEVNLKTERGSSLNY